MFNYAVTILCAAATSPFSGFTNQLVALSLTSNDHFYVRCPYWSSTSRPGTVGQSKMKLHKSTEQAIRNCLHREKTFKRCAKENTEETGK